jgi:hypothetical protein
MDDINVNLELTFDLMCEIEPGLIGLVAQAEKFKNLSYSDKENLWYRNLKKQMMRMVGFEAKNKLLCSTDCYEIAYHKLIDILDI